MILTEVQGYLRTRERASLAQLSTRFGTQPDALRGMLDRLVAKGRVRRLKRPALCAGCTICPPEAFEFYEWAGAAPAPPTPTCAIDTVLTEARGACPHCG